MWGKARTRSNQGKKQRDAAQRNTRNVRPADFSSRVGITSRQPRTPRAGRGHPPSQPPVASTQDVGPAQTSQTGGQRAEDKARQAHGASSLASLSQNSKPLAFWKQHRRPNHRPAARNFKINRPAGTAAQPLPHSWQASIIRVSTMTLDPRPIPPAAAGNPGSRPQDPGDPSLASPPKPPQAAQAGFFRAAERSDVRPLGLIKPTRPAMIHSWLPIALALALHNT